MRFTSETEEIVRDVGERVFETAKDMDTCLQEAAIRIEQQRYEGFNTFVNAVREIWIGTVDQIVACYESTVVESSQKILTSAAAFESLESLQTALNETRDLLEEMRARAHAITELQSDTSNPRIPDRESELYQVYAQLRTVAEYQPRDICEDDYIARIMAAFEAEVARVFSESGASFDAQLQQISDNIDARQQRSRFITEDSARESDVRATQAVEEQQSSTKRVSNGRGSGFSLLNGASMGKVITDMKESHKGTLKAAKIVAIPASLGAGAVKTIKDVAEGDLWGLTKGASTRVKTTLKFLANFDKDEQSKDSATDGEKARKTAAQVLLERVAKCVKAKEFYNTVKIVDNMANMFGEGDLKNGLEAASPLVAFGIVWGPAIVGAIMAREGRKTPEEVSKLLTRERLERIAIATAIVKDGFTIVRFVANPKKTPKEIYKMAKAVIDIPSKTVDLVKSVRKSLVEYTNEKKPPPSDGFKKRWSLKLREIDEKIKQMDKERMAHGDAGFTKEDRKWYARRYKWRKTANIIETFSKAMSVVDDLVSQTDGVANLGGKEIPWSALVR